MRRGGHRGARLTKALTAAAMLGVATPAAGQGGAPSPPPRPRPGVDVLNYDLTLALPDTGRVVRGRATLTVRRFAPEDSLVLDLVGLQVDSVLVDGAAAPFRRTAETIRVRLPSAPAAGEDTLAVTVRYDGAPKDGLIISTDSLGRWRAFGDNWPDRARFWIPGVDHPADKATVTWTVIAPSDRRIVANGALREETPLGILPGSPRPRTLTRWRESKPIPLYLMVIAAAPLARVDLPPTACGRGEDGGCVEQQIYVAPEERAFVPGPFSHAGDIVDWISRLIAPFPYEKLAHVQSSTIFGGMENATAIFYADQSFRRHTLTPGTIAHETAHQWFGDAVTERDWSDLWLSEGFATYFDALWERHAFGDSTFRALMTRLRDEVIAAPVVAQRPVIDTAQTDLLRLLNENSYQKGGWVLHMMRTMVGDSAFFRGLRAYFHAHEHGNADSRELEQAVATAWGRPLDWFFDEWLRRPGYAELTTSWAWDARTRRVTVTVTQGTRFGAYRFPLVVELATGAGARRVTIDVPAEHESRLTLPIEMSDEPTQVTFDPDVQLLATFAAR